MPAALPLGTAPGYVRIRTIVRLRTAWSGGGLCYSAAVDLTDQPFSRALRRLRRERAARGGRDAWFLHRRAGEELAERLDLVSRPFSRALDLSAGESGLADRLRERGIETVAGAESELPLISGEYDLVVSVGLLDTINDLPGALALIRRALKPGGLFLAAFAGAGSLVRLRQAMRAADEAEAKGAAARIHPQIDVRAAGDLMLRAGFALPVVDREVIEVGYASLADLVADLRAMGAGNMLASARPPLGRIGLAAARADFEREGRTVERFEIVYLSGWAPD